MSKNLCQIYSKQHHTRQSPNLSFPKCERGHLAQPLDQDLGCHDFDPHVIKLETFQPGKLAQ